MMSRRRMSALTAQRRPISVVLALLLGYRLIAKLSTGVGARARYAEVPFLCRGSVFQSPKKLLTATYGKTAMQATDRTRNAIAAMMTAVALATVLIVAGVPTPGGQMREMVPAAKARVPVPMVGVRPANSPTRPGLPPALDHGHGKPERRTRQNGAGRVSCNEVGSAAISGGLRIAGLHVDAGQQQRPSAAPGCRRSAIRSGASGRSCSEVTSIHAHSATADGARFRGRSRRRGNARPALRRRPTDESAAPGNDHTSRERPVLAFLLYGFPYLGTGGRERECLSPGQWPEVEIICVRPSPARRLGSTGTAGSRVPRRAGSLRAPSRLSPSPAGYGGVAADRSATRA